MSGKKSHRSCILANILSSSTNYWNHEKWLKSIHFKNPVALSSFSIQHQLNQNKVSWCCIENDNDFERNEDRATVFLKWTDFSLKFPKVPRPRFRIFLKTHCSVHLYRPVLVLFIQILSRLILILSKFYLDQIRIKFE